MESQASRAPRTVRVSFGGQVGEYFRIWIVNTALTIVTLGVYSAWATVRKRRYFYTHTSVEDGNFDYHAKPIGILIGRLVAVLMLGAYFASSYISPLAPLVVVAVIGLLVPWLVVRSRIFNLRNTSLHGLRFNFRRNYSGAAKAYYGGMLLILVTLGLGSPTALYWRHKFAVDNSGYGRTPFGFHGEQGAFYGIILRALGLSLLAMVAVMAVVGIVSFLAADLLQNAPGQEPPMWFSLAVGLPIMLVYLGIAVYTQVRLVNYVWNSSSLKGNRFVSSLSARSVFGLYLGNLLAIAASLGLLIPWAQIRMARYRASAMELVLVDEWQTLAAASREGGSALGDEIGQAFDVDVDFAF
jgi:uncharacterized membrane protein YjgN (DUF898 family)